MIYDLRRFMIYNLDLWFIIIKLQKYLRISNVFQDLNMGFLDLAWFILLYLERMRFTKVSGPSDLAGSLFTNYNYGDKQMPQQIILFGEIRYSWNTMKCLLCGILILLKRCNTFGQDFLIFNFRIMWFLLQKSITCVKFGSLQSNTRLRCLISEF